LADYPFTSCSGGHNRVACFFDDRDRFVYLGWLREALERERCRLHAYQCAADRSAAIWTQALRAALEELTVEVVQGTRVEAKALRRHHTHDCQAQHSPGLFHVQHEVSKATSWHLARQVKQAPARVAAAAATWQEARAAEKACHARGTHPRGRPPAFPARSQAALQAVAAAEVEHQQAQTHQKEARALIRALGQRYHPYDLASGQAQPVAAVAARFEALWQRLQRLAAAVDLPTRAREHLAKAQRVTTRLLATLAFVVGRLQAKIEALNLSSELEDALRCQLIPAIYLQRVATRTGEAAQRHALHALNGQLLPPCARAPIPSSACPPPSGRTSSRSPVIAPTLPAQQLRCGGTRWAAGAVSPWPPPPQPPQARGPHRRAQLSHPLPRSHHGGGALLWPEPPALV
jgi:hypothetical protein